jgi:putative toxin-antitoxin system antitoxin component (TIGR02293 family)
LSQPAVVHDRPEPSRFYRRLESKLGSPPLHTDQDVARLVETRLPLSTLGSLTSHGVSDAEIYNYILPRRTLAHRKSRQEPLTHEESDRAVRIARIVSLAEQVFGEDDKAARWLRKPKIRFEGRTKFELLRTEAGARLVEELLLQFQYGFVA